MILNMESLLIIQNQMKIWESGFCFAFWKCFPRLGNWDWSGRMHSTGNQEWLGNLPGTSCEALGSHSAPCLTAALRKMMLSACRGWEAVEQQDKILVFLERAFVWNSSVMVLQALDFPVLEEISRAVFGKSSGFKTNKQKNLYNCQQIYPYRCL